jgi:hypothetical protein
MGFIYFEKYCKNVTPKVDHPQSFSGAFVKLRKVNVSVFIFVSVPFPPRGKLCCGMKEFS